MVMIISMSLMLTACLGMPERVTPVKNFELDRYLGKWYEIARLDHSFERGLNNITAEYTLRDDGGVLVPMFANYVQAVNNRIMSPDTVGNLWQMDNARMAERWSVA